MADANSQLYQAAAIIVPLVLAIVIHEMAHGLTARALGDPTAEEAGRLSFNPLRHVDLIGTIILPGMLALTGAPVFGWAKPVPVNMWRLRNPRRDMMLVAAAGPASNFVMAALAAVAVGLMARFGNPQLWIDRFVGESVAGFLIINLSLCLFNLIPIPPFDGSHIVEGLLPEGLARRFASIRRYGMLVPILLIVVLPMVLHINLVSSLIGPPMELVTGWYLRLASWVAGQPLDFR